MFTYKVIQSYNQLELEVYNYVVQNEAKVANMKIRELADITHVSTTTILRFCKKTGCDSYTEFKLRLRQMQLEEKRTEVTMDMTAMEDFFRRIQTQVFQDLLMKAVDILAGSTVVLFVGVGNSAIIGKYGARYFNNVGWISFNIEDPFSPILRERHGNTAVIAMSVSGETKEILAMVSHLKKKKCSIISVTNTSDCSLARISDCNIPYYIKQQVLKENYDITSQIPAVYIIEAMGRLLKGRDNKNEELFEGMIFP